MLVLMFLDRMSSGHGKMLRYYQYGQHWDTYRGIAQGHPSADVGDGITVM